MFEKQSLETAFSRYWKDGTIPHWGHSLHGGGWGLGAGHQHASASGMQDNEKLSLLTVGS